jgi:hypothetical protein
MYDVNSKLWTNFAQKVEALCSEFIHAVECDRYSPAEVIQAACNIIAVAIEETEDKELAIKATRRWINAGLEKAKAGCTAQIVN